MIDNQMKRQDLMRAAEITSYAATKINKNEPVWIIAQEENNPHIIELTDRKKIDHMIILYWD